MGRRSSQILQMNYFKSACSRKVDCSKHAGKVTSFFAEGDVVDWFLNLRTSEKICVQKFNKRLWL